jgi:hypothetical protein
MTCPHPAPVTSKHRLTAAGAHPDVRDQVPLGLRAVVALVVPGVGHVRHDSRQRVYRPARRSRRVP